MASITTGETVMNVSKGIDTYSFKVPLGVTAGVVPFNFPFMCPLWMVPLAITNGNTFILKPSERVPTGAGLIAKYCNDVGIPKGVVSLANGGFDTVKDIVHNPDIRAVSFIGGNNAGEYIYNECAKTGKRCQTNLAAKNHSIVMPDADKDDALNNLVGAAFGASG